MNDLINPLSFIIQQASQLPDSGVAANYQHRLASGNPNIFCLLLDTSGSMGSECNGKETRIDVLRKAVKSLDWQYYQMFTFDNLCRRIASPDALWNCCGGSTNLALGLQEIAKFDPSKTIVISDGEPNDEDDALAAARKLTGTISTVFIGNDRDKNAIAFMRRLSTVGCGNTFVRDLGKGHLELSATLQHLMLSPSKY
jgi:hypothetical protein